MMRFLIGSATASLLLAGAVIAGGSPAYAGDDIFFNHAAGTMSASPDTSEAQAPVRTQPYMQIEPRDAKVTASKEGVEGDNIYYDHAEGTMSGNPVDTGPSVGDRNGQYTASYHQYMKMDPRDEKPVPKQASEDNNIYFNHAQGTMSGD